jgi:hypothetical protein
LAGPADAALPGIPGVAVDVVPDETRLKAELSKQVTIVVHETFRTTTDHAATDPAVTRAEVHVDPESIRILLT